MPWGVVVLATFSWMVYRRARNTGRSPFGWVLILWGSAYAGGVLGVIAGAALGLAGLGEHAIPAGGLGGILAAVVVVVRAAGRPARVARVAEWGGAREADRPEAVP